jgi:hypothetical protein
MEVACSSKMLVPTHQTTQCHNPEDCNMNMHYSERLNIVHFAIGDWVCGQADYIFLGFLRGYSQILSLFKHGFLFYGFYNAA